MTNRIRQHSTPSENNSVGLNGSRFELIEPSPPQLFGTANPAQLHELAFLQARAMVERARWQRLLEKIFEQED